MIKHYITIEEAEQIIFRNLTLLDEDLVIKKPNKDETYIIEPIIFTSRSKNEVHEFAKECKNKGYELLLEIQPESLKTEKFTTVDIQSYELLDNGKYNLITSNFEPRTVKLLEFDVINQLRNVPEDQYKVVVVLPSPIDKEGLLLSEKRSVILTMGSNFTTRREMLNEYRMGSDLYILPKNPELFEKYKEWLVELNEVTKNVYQMKKRSYYFIKPLSQEELTFLTREEIKLYYSLIINQKTFNINEEELITINRTKFAKLIKEEIPFKNRIETYNQEGLSLNRISLEEALNYQSYYL